MPKLSFEGLGGLVLALIVVILDQAGIKNPWVLWISFALAVFLCVDAVVRSDWHRRRRILTTACVVFAFLIFGAYLVRQSHHGQPKTETHSIQRQAEAPPSNAEQIAEAIAKKIPRPAHDTNIVEQKDTTANVKVRKQQKEQLKDQPRDQPSVVVNAPQGIGITGGIVNNPTVINTAPPQRTLTEEQKNAIQRIGQVLPANVSIWVRTIDSEEASHYGMQFFQALRRGAYEKSSMTQDPEYRGVWLQVNSHDRAMGEKFAQALLSMGVKIDPIVLEVLDAREGQMQLCIGLPD